jgi:broad specificity phosphatase PhoE
MFSQDDTLHILTVRHGRSTNNDILEQLYQRHASGEITEHELEQTWLRTRTTDPNLTKLGQEEAIKLGCWIKDSNIVATRRLLIFTSPFKRTLDTTAGILSSLSATTNNDDVEVVVHPFIYETGGVYVSSSEGRRVGPGKCMTASEISQSFPNYDVSLLPSKGPWYISSWENDATTNKRAVKMARWMKGSDHSSQQELSFLPGLRQFIDATSKAGDQRGVLVLMVMHGDFINHLTKALCNIQNEDAYFGKDKNVFENQPVNIRSANTATSLFSIARSGHVAVSWMSSTQHLGHTARERMSRL